MRCNCENSHCKICHNKGCKTEVDGRIRAMYIGAICEPCSKYMPSEYLIKTEMTITSTVYIETELPWRGDHVMVEANRRYELLGPWDEEGNRDPLCNPVYLFRVFQYNELTQNYEVPISDQLTEDENFQFQKLLYEHDCDEACAAAEARYDRE